MKIKKIIIISAIIFLLIIVLSTIYLLLPKTTLTLAIAPSSVKLTIDNNKPININNGDKINISSGKHKIILSQDEFESHKSEITIIENKNQELLVALKPLTENAQKILNKNENQPVVERFYGNVRKNREDNIEKNFPVIAILPYSSQSFNMKMCKSKKYPDDNTKVALCIILHRNDENIKNIAIKMLKSKGYYREDYEIVWSQDYYNGS